MIKPLLIIALLFPLSFSNGNKDEVIVWNSHAKISWSDFKGKPKQHEQHIAMSKCGISMEQSSYALPYGKPVFAFYAYFVPDGSWYIADKVSNETLAHEQLHFDIAELFARKLRERFYRHEYSPEKAKKVFDETYKAYHKMQQLYDAETHHGRFQDNQSRWRRKIGLQLEKLNSFKQ